MKVFKDKTIPSRVEKKLTGTFCDMCKSEIKEEMWNVDEVEVTRDLGVRYPEGGNIETTSVDLCGKCFSEKLVPWLENQGCEIQTEECDY